MQVFLIRSGMQCPYVLLFLKEHFTLCFVFSFLKTPLLPKVWVFSFSIILVGRRFVWTFWTVLLLTVKYLKDLSRLHRSGTNRWLSMPRAAQRVVFIVPVHSFIQVFNWDLAGAAMRCFTDIVCQYLFSCNFLYSFHCVQSNILGFGLQYPTHFRVYLLGDSFLNDKHLIRWTLTQATVLLSVMFLKGSSVKQKFVGAFILPLFLIFWFMKRAG